MAAISRGNVNFIQEILWRGMLQDIVPETEKFLLEKPSCGYAGFDPTADSLHIGNLVPVMLLVHFQRAGHKPLALLGGATGRVGDPSGSGLGKRESRRTFYALCTNV